MEAAKLSFENEESLWNLAGVSIGCYWGLSDFETGPWSWLHAGWTGGWHWSRQIGSNAANKRQVLQQSDNFNPIFRGF